MPSLSIIILTISPLYYLQWKKAVRIQLTGAAMDIVTRRWKDEACDLEQELLADLAGRSASAKRMVFCFRATWCLAAGYLARCLMRPPPGI